MTSAGLPRGTFWFVMPCTILAPEIKKETTLDFFFYLHSCSTVKTNCNKTISPLRKSSLVFCFGVFCFCQAFIIKVHLFWTLSPCVFHPHTIVCEYIVTALETLFGHDGCVSFYFPSQKAGGGKMCHTPAMTHKSKISPWIRWQASLTANTQREKYDMSNPFPLTSSNFYYFNFSKWKLALCF